MNQKQRDDLLISVVTGLNDFRKEIKNDMIELKTEIRETRKKVNENTERITSLEEKVDKNTERITCLEERITSLEEKVDRNTERITSLEEKVDKNTMQLTELDKYTKENIDGTAQIFRDLSQYLIDNINSVKRRVETNEREISTLKTRLA